MTFRFKDFRFHTIYRRITMENTTNCGYFCKKK